MARTRKRIVTHDRTLPQLDRALSSQSEALWALIAVITMTALMEIYTWL